MKHFRPLLFVILAFVISVRVDAQTIEGDALATSTGMTYKSTSLSPNGQRIFLERTKLIADARKQLLAAMIGDILLGLESKAQNTTSERLLDLQKSKVAEPTATEIQAVYNANRERLAGRSLEEVRGEIIEFIKHDAEDKAVDTFLASLRAKYKVETGKDVTSVGLAPAEVLATIGQQKITVQDFEREQRVRLNDIEMEIFEELKADLELAIFSTLVNEDAKARNISTQSYIASEITDKLREFTDEERAAVESDLMNRLFTKYNVRILLTEPTPLVQNVSVDDDPVIGNATAPVTIVMFTDFQCPACSRTHPVLKHAISQYGDKVRLVVRDFPLESIHPNAFDAALAANAARAQGKFMEYGEILYRNQGALERTSLVKYAGALGLNVKQFELDFSDAKTAAEVRKDQADGRSYGIGGTPTIFVNGVKVHKLSLQGLRGAIDRALKKTSTSSH
ncbi:MAG TPA: thioredoxin domain-containing protein [Pyrinomonadaceae bacterium]